MRQVFKEMFEKQVNQNITSPMQDKVEIATHKKDWPKNDKMSFSEHKVHFHPPRFSQAEWQMTVTTWQLSCFPHAVLNEKTLLSSLLK